MKRIKRIASLLLALALAFSLAVGCFAQDAVITRGEAAKLLLTAADDYCPIRKNRKQRSLLPRGKNHLQPGRFQDQRRNGYAPGAELPSSQGHDSVPNAAIRWSLRGFRKPTPQKGRDKTLQGRTTGRRSWLSAGNSRKKFPPRTISAARPISRRRNCGTPWQLMGPMAASVRKRCWCSVTVPCSAVPKKASC